MRYFRWLGTLVLGSAAAVAQTASIHGNAVSAKTGEPLASVDVSLIGPATEIRSVRSGLDGSFRFADLAIGEYGLTLSKAGFEAGQRVSRSVAVEADGERVKPRVELQPSAALAGRVIDSFGEPLANAVITLGEWNTYHGRRRMQLVKTGRSNDLGEYRLHGLGPGSYVLCVRPLTLPAPKGVLAFEYSSQCYPEAARADTAPPLRLGWGEERTGLDFALEASELTAIEGAVLTEQGGRCANCTVEVIAFGSDTVGGVTTTADGLFAVRGLDSGEYELAATTRGRVAVGYGRVFVSGEEPVEAILRTAGVHAVSGDVRVSSGEFKGRLRVELLPAGGAMPTRRQRRSLDVAASGEFKFDEVLPGRYYFRVSGADSVYLDEVRLQSGPTPNGELAVSEAGPPGRVSLWIGADGGAVQGNVRGDGPTSPGLAVLLPKNYGKGRRWELTASYRNSTGFYFGAVPPGDYHLFAVPQKNHFDLGNDEDLRILRSGGKLLRVGPSQTVQAEAPFIPNPD